MAQLSTFDRGSPLNRLETHSTGTSFTEVSAVTSIKTSYGLFQTVSKTYYQMRTTVIYVTKVIGEQLEIHCSKVKLTRNKT
jgi:hypothetical protein